MQRQQQAAALHQRPWQRPTALSAAAEAAQAQQAGGSSGAQGDGQGGGPPPRRAARPTRLTCSTVSANQLPWAAVPAAQQHPQQQQHQRQQQHAEAPPREAAGGHSVGGRRAPPPPFAWALPPIGGGGGGGNGAQAQPQSQQPQKQRPFWLAPFSGGAGGGDAGAGERLLGSEHQQQPHHHHNNHHGGGGSGLHVEAGKVVGLVGLVGAQLVIHFANHLGHLQRQAAQHRENLQSRLPWHGLRLPWHRGGAAGGAQPGGDAAGGGAGGARHAWAAGDAARSWVAKGAAAERSLQLREALACYQSALALDPSNLENLCRVAKQWSDLTYEPGATTDDVVVANSKAVEYADRAIALAPQWSGGYVAACVSRGRLALVSDNKTKVRLAKEAREAAVTALELDPTDDLAHHLMGRWHYEMAQINFVVRQLVRLVYGASLAPGTLTDALAEFQAAAALSPGRLIHRVELGRTYLRLGRKAEALRELQAGVELEVEDVNAALERDEAEAMLARLRREFARGVAPLAWGGGGGGGGGGGAGGGAQVVEEE
ncbi:hypothetical protein Rsub_10922 [Raphidocelis subcapitata]|uniref:Regulator of microtubule dynamics protein 1 n=1 Tax=Raphidocelis subcapitata TaxID=307507 RepID=A0A2V0PFF8_9CHLO|nr:hypothetical protein Rsub_10922 [Raphidocelis subcapitata]|eukprot:GBF98259.1 hypothetical protein Rsub_10922 [Raphidocelis subcapitata]